MPWGVEAPFAGDRHECGHERQEAATERADAHRLCDVLPGQIGSGGCRGPRGWAWSSKGLTLCIPWVYTHWVQVASTSAVPTIMFRRSKYFVSQPSDGVQVHVAAILRQSRIAFAALPEFVGFS